MKKIGRVIGWLVGLGVLIVLGMAVREKRPEGSLKESDATVVESASPRAEADAETGSAEVEAAPAGREKAWELESQEAAFAALALAKENEDLRRQVGGLQKQVRELTEALAAQDTAAVARKRVAGPSGFPDSEQPGTGVLTTPRALRLIDVNESLGMVVLDAGSRGGIKPGMRFSVVRDERPVARIRVVEVRADIAGAEVEESLSAGFSRKGDHVVPWKKPGS